MKFVWEGFVMVYRRSVVYLERLMYYNRGGVVYGSFERIKRLVKVQIYDKESLVFKDFIVTGIMSIFLF